MTPKCIESSVMPSNELLVYFGFELRDIIGDGNCQYRAVADQIFGDQKKYKYIKKSILNNLDMLITSKLKEFGMSKPDNDTIFSLKYYMKDTTWGDNFTLQAIANTFTDYCIKVYYICKVNGKDTLKTKFVYPEDSEKCINLKEINLYLQGEIHYTSLIKKHNIKKIKEEIHKILKEVDLQTTSIRQLRQKLSKNLNMSFEDDVKKQIVKRIVYELINNIEDNADIQYEESLRNEILYIIKTKKLKSKEIRELIGKKFKKDYTVGVNKKLFNNILKEILTK